MRRLYGAILSRVLVWSGYLCLVLLAGGCGRPIDPAFLPYVATFERLGGIPVDVSMQFDPALPRPGRCVSDIWGRRVVINPTDWAEMDGYLREAIIFHELGHCILTRDHDDLLLLGGQPESLMNSILIDENVYLAHRAYYWLELFHPGISTWGLSLNVDQSPPQLSPAARADGATIFSYQ